MKKTLGIITVIFSSTGRHVEEGQQISNEVHE